MMPAPTKQQGWSMPFKDIFKRQVEDLFNSKSKQRHPSLGRELNNEFERMLGDAIDPGREEREAAKRAAELDKVRREKGTGQPVMIEGIPGDWEAIDLFHLDETSAAYTLIDRNTGDNAQLSAVDDGTVILDSPGDQFGTTIAGAFWRTASHIGIRLDGAELTADGTRRVRVTCDLRDELPPEEPDYQEPPYTE